MKINDCVELDKIRYFLLPSSIFILFFSLKDKLRLYTHIIIAFQSLDLKFIIILVILDLVGEGNPFN